MESWISDRVPVVTDQQYGANEDSTLALLKKHEAIAAEIEGYKGRVEELTAESEGLIEKKHFGTLSIEKKQVTK